MKLKAFIQQFSGELESAGRFRALSSRQSTLNSVTAFCGTTPPTLKMVYTKDFLHRYEEYLIAQGRARNTCAYYMSVLRSIYNTAVKQGKVSYTPDLFAKVFTGSDPTIKRAISSKVISKIHYADLSQVAYLEFCRDLFMLSFHLQGMPFVDIAHLRKSDINDDYIVYRRHKTGGVVSVSILPPAKKIIDKYASKTQDSPYVLPIITLPGAKGYLQRQTALRRQNRQLKLLADYLNIDENLTSYTARHSWATLAYHNGVEVSLVSQAMGHHTEEITRVYLSSFDQTRITEANLIVLNTILRPEEREQVRLPDSQIHTSIVNRKQNNIDRHGQKRRKKRRNKAKAKYSYIK